MDQLQYEEACKYVGKLFLESNHQIETQRASFQNAIQDLSEQLTKTKQERDDALRLLTKREPS